MQKTQPKETKKYTAPTSLKELQKMIQKEHGPGTITQGLNGAVRVDSFPTGIPTIDMALGCGGLPQGRVIEIYGQESCGKTTTCLHLIAACQKHQFTKKGRKGVAAFIDAEHAFDPTWAEKCGVNIKELLFSQPDSGEQTFDIIHALVKSGLVDLVVIDSVANLVPLKEMEGDMDTNAVGAQARLMSHGLRMISGPASKSKTTVIFINQVRQKIGILYGSPDTTPGGLALKFYTSIRCEIKKGAAIKSGDKTIGFKPVLKTVKNKCAPPFRTAEFVISLDQVFGLDPVQPAVAAGLELGVLTKKSSYFQYGGKNLAQGEESTITYFRNHPEVFNEVLGKIYENLNLTIQRSIIEEDLGEPDDLSNELLDDQDSDELIAVHINEE